MINILKVKQLSDTAKIPTKAYPTDSGFDLYTDEYAKLAPGETRAIATNIAFELPEGYEIQVRPRSGITTKTTLKVILGTIDETFRGHAQIMVHNSGSIPFEITKGTKLAQAVPMAIPKFEIEVVETLNETTRGEKGFGSSGIV